MYVEEFEAIYLCDHEGKLQAEAAESMGVSRPTLTRIYASARRKIADALVGGKRHFNQIRDCRPSRMT